MYLRTVRLPVDYTCASVYVPKFPEMFVLYSCSDLVPEIYIIWLRNMSLLFFFLVRNSLNIFLYSEACSAHWRGGKYRNIQSVNC